ncbi:unnamed protein product [Rhizoctonia solani]|uniref:Minor extracellular protease vpr n=1 Tax=Rhizoctonia solani TaxID=456999 RepID=A0A8H3E533_9AGAM|nr:unnamed protein product [Rhizoctonia solani]
MKFLVPLALIQLVSATVDVKSIKHASTVKAVPNCYIVELSPDSHLKRGFVSPHEELYHDLERRNVKINVVKEYADDLLIGAAVKLDNKADLVKLAGADGVLSITPNYLHPPPKPVYQKPIKHSSTPRDVFSPHVMTGVDKLHAEGLTGKGIKIGIIDSGVDYTHPSLGGKFGPGNKIIGGYDFVGDAYTGSFDSPPPAPDNDPLDQCNGHGTHVAGIIGADPNNPWNISGVAYKSKINAYRIFGCEGGSPDDIIIESLIRAWRDGNHVITLSLGGPDGWTESVSGVVASRIADKGRIVTIAAGNEGDFGAWYASGPGTGRSVISVGSVDNAVLNIQSAIVSNGRKIPYLSLEPIDIPGGLPLYATTNDPSIPNDACDPLPSQTPDLSSSLVLIRRGTCSFATKLDNAAAKGAKYFLIYDNVDEPPTTIEAGDYVAAIITQVDGLFLLQEAIPKKYTVSFPNDPSTIPNPTGGLVSSFSTYGPSYDMYLKPALSAPGGSILSTFPVTLGSFAVESGTSMATPFVAGSAALLLQAKGKSTAIAKAARNIFQNAAIPVKQTALNGSLVETASHQGAGLIDVYNAIKNTAKLLPSELLLNDTAYFKGERTLTLHNEGKKSVTYTITHVPAGTAQTIDGIEAVPGPVPLVDKAANVEINHKKVTVHPGSTASVHVTFKPPKGLDPKTFPVYSGYIKATGSDHTTLRSTYLGVAAKLKDAKVLDTTAAYFDVQLPVITDDEGNPIPPGQTATYINSGPLVLYRLVMGTPLFRLDLIDSKTKVPKRHSHSARSKGDIRNWLFNKNKSGSFAGVKTLGVLYEEDYLPRNSLAPTSDENGFSAIQVAGFANGTDIPAGSYKILLRALKITGDPKKEGDYEVWTSPTVVIKYE